MATTPCFNGRRKFTIFTPARASLKKPASRAAWERRRAELLSQLNDKVFRWFPTAKIPFETKASKSGGGWTARYGYADYKDCSFQSEEGVRVRAQLFTPKNRRPNTPLLIFVRRAADSFYSADSDELLPLISRYTVLVVNPRFTELSMGPAEYTDIERSAAWIGRT